MKKFLISVVALLVLSFVGKIAGNFFGEESAADFVQKEAKQQHMPTGFYGVNWLASKDELQAIRNNLVEDSDGMLSELNMLYDRPVKVRYYIATGNLIMFAFGFSDAVSEEIFQKTNLALDRDFGPMLPSMNEVDTYGSKYCSHRKSDRFSIDHCLRMQGQFPVETLVIYRTKSPE